MTTLECANCKQDIKIFTDLYLVSGMTITCLCCGKKTIIALEKKGETNE